MTCRSLLLGALSIGGLGMLACGSDEGADGASGGVTVTGVVKRFAPGMARQQFDTLRGVTVCVHDHDEVACDTTDGSGTYVLKNVPSSSKLLISFEREDYVRGVRMLVTKESDYDILAETVLGELQLGIDQAELLGVDLTSVSGGGLQFFAAKPGDGVLQTGPFGPYTAALKTLDGEPAICDSEDGEVPCEPMYLDENGDVDPDLTEASPVGVGGFGNVPEGEYIFQVSSPGLVCDQALAESGWGIERKHGGVRVKVIEGWATMQAGLFCEPE